MKNILMTLFLMAECLAALLPRNGRKSIGKPVTAASGHAESI